MVAESTNTNYNGIRDEMLKLSESFNIITVQL